MYCPNCGNPNEKNAKFCIKCGARLSEPGQPKGRSKLVVVLISMVVVLTLILVVAVVWLLRDRPEPVPTPAAIATLPATAGTQGASPSPSLAATSSPSAKPTPLQATVEPTQVAEPQEVQPPSDLPTLVYSSGTSQDINHFKVAGGKLFIVYYPSYQVRVVDVRSGTELWTADLTNLLWTPDADLVYTMPFELRIDALDANTGEFRWHYLSEEPLGPMRKSNDRFVVFSEKSDSERLYVISKSDGTLMSTSGSGIDRVASCPQWGTALSVRGDLVFLSETGQLERWRPDLECYQSWDYVLHRLTDPFDPGPLAPPYPSCDDMLVCLTGEELAAFDPNTCTQLWTSDLDVTADSGYGMIKCGTENIYIRVGNRWQGRSKETGELRWIGPPSSLQLSMDVRDPATDVWQWVGEAGDMHVYSHLGYGLTRAYDGADHAMLWENPQVTLSHIVGVADDTLIGVLWEPDSDYRQWLGIAVGLDSRTGNELWRREVGIDDYGHTYIELMYGRLLYVSPGMPGIRFLDPRSGDLIMEIPIEKHWSAQFASVDGLIVVLRDEELVVIRP